MCWAGFVRQQCESTCEVCTKASGQDFNDDMTGRAVLPFPGGKNFVGSVSGGKPNGLGVLTWGNSARHIGEFSNGNPKPNTNVMRIDKNGRAFIGKYKSWLYDVGLEYQVPGGNIVYKYSASWTADYKMNDGTCAIGYKNARFDGQCRSGDAASSGAGTMLWNDDLKFDGTWSNGSMSSGTLSWGSGKSYTGAFSSGKPHGQGKFVWSAGTYDGAWRDGKPNGSGVITFTGAGKFTANWTKGKGTGKYCAGDKCADWSFNLY